MKMTVTEDLKGLLGKDLKDILFSIYLDQKLSGKVIFKLSKNYYYQRKQLMQEIDIIQDDKENIFYCLSVMEEPVNVCLSIEEKKRLI